MTRLINICVIWHRRKSPGAPLEQHAAREPLGRRSTPSPHQSECPIGHGQCTLHVGMTKIPGERSSSALLGARATFCLALERCFAVALCWSCSSSAKYGVATISRLLKITVSFAKEPYKRDDILQKRPIISRSLLIEATP